MQDMDSFGELLFPAFRELEESESKSRAEDREQFVLPTVEELEAEGMGSTELFVNVHLTVSLVQMSLLI